MQFGREDEALESLRCGRGCDGRFYYAKSIRTGPSALPVIASDVRRTRTSSYIRAESCTLQFPNISVYDGNSSVTKRHLSMRRLLARCPRSRIHKGTGRIVVG